MMRRTAAPFVALLWIALLGGSASAQLVTEPVAPPEQTQSAAPRDYVKSVLGAWEFSNSARDKLCGITLRGEAGSNGQRLDIGKDCGAVFPFIKDVVAWKFAENDFLRLFDAKGEVIIEFSEVEMGLFESLKAGEGVMFLQSAASAGPPPRTTDQMTGEWAIVRGAGRPVCGLTLTNRASGPDGFALRLKPGCDTAVTRFNPTVWQMDRSELVLMSARGETWRFEETDPKTWQRIPERAEPILMVRQ
jgi:hypothetical protein